MRWTLCCLILLAACRSRIEGERESDFYGGFAVSGLPDVGGSVIAGQYISKSQRRNLAFEMRATLQDGDDSATQNGKFFQVQAGIKQIMDPGDTKHLYFRYGLTWFRANGNPNFLDVPGDYLGAFGAIGYDWDLTERITVGPEVAVNLVGGEGSIGVDFLPQVALSVIFNF